MSASSSSSAIPSDGALITRLRQGDASAFEMLFRRHSVSVLRFAQSFAADPDTAEDMMQAVFGWVWMRRTEFAPPDNFLAYLFGAVRNRALHHARMERDRATITERAGPEVSAGIAQHARSIDEIIADRDSVALIWYIVDGIHEPQRTIFFLRWRHGLDWETIASIVGISVGAARTQHSRVLALIRERLPGTFGE